MPALVHRSRACGRPGRATVSKCSTGHSGRKNGPMPVRSGAPCCRSTEPSGSSLQRTSSGLPAIRGQTDQNAESQAKTAISASFSAWLSWVGSGGAVTPRLESIALWSCQKLSELTGHNASQLKQSYIKVTELRRVSNYELLPTDTRKGNVNLPHISTSSDHFP